MTLKEAIRIVGQELGLSPEMCKTAELDSSFNIPGAGDTPLPPGKEREIIELIKKLHIAYRENPECRAFIDQKLADAITRQQKHN